MMLICPKCDGEIDAFRTAPWGDGQQSTQKFAPYVCGWCGSLFIVDIEGRSLLDPEALKRQLHVDVLAILQRNQVLWAAITEGQERIRAMPQRRPVLR